MDYLQTLYDLMIQFVPKLIGVFVLLFLSWVVARWTGKRITGTLSKNLDITLARFFGNLGRYAVLIMALLGSLSIFGFETTSFAAVIGAAGLAVGLALQGTLSNFSSGVMLLIFKPFRVGDVVSVSGSMGKVTEIGLFTTEFDTPDNRRIIVPNGTIFGSTIENITHHETRRVDVNVGTDYGADLNTTRRILEDAADAAQPRLDEPGSQVFLVDLGDSSINWQVRVWTQTEDYFATREHLTYEVKSRLDGAGIGIPFPQMDVHLDPGQN